MCPESGREPEHMAQQRGSQIDLHVRLHGRENIQDQETVGLLGLNLIYGAMHLHSDPPALLKSLLASLNTTLLEIDMVDFSGPAFREVDNRLMALRLVQLGLSGAAMFRPLAHPVDNSKGSLLTTFYIPCYDLAPVCNRIL